MGALFFEKVKFELCFERLEGVDAAELGRQGVPDGCVLLGEVFDCVGWLLGCAVEVGDDVTIRWHPVPLPLHSTVGPLKRPENVGIHRVGNQGAGKSQSVQLLLRLFRPCDPVSNAPHRMSMSRQCEIATRLARDVTQDTLAGQLLRRHPPNTPPPDAMNDISLIETCELNDVTDRAPKQAQILEWITSQERNEFSRKNIISALNMPPRTVEEAVKKLLNHGYLIRIGQGAGTRYKKKI